MDPALAAQMGEAVAQKLLQYRRDESGWKICREDNGVSVCWRPSVEFPGNLYRGEGIVNGAPEYVWDFVKPLPGSLREKWDENVTSFEVLQSITDALCVTRMATPSAAMKHISPRDFVDLVRVRKYEDGALSSNAVHVDHALCPPRPGYVRGSNHPCGCFCEPVPGLVVEDVASLARVGIIIAHFRSLRAKTNPYIKTPVHGEEPVFVVMGRKEDVAMALRTVISATEHFSMIGSSRNKNSTFNGALPGPLNLPGYTTIQVRVPYRVVGLVVGFKGTTIRRIQKRTHTYILTPSRHKEPVFEVTGMPENVDRAREEIEAIIAGVSGGIELTDENDFHSNGTDVGFDLQYGSGGCGTGGLWSKPFSSYCNNSCSSLGSASTDWYFGGSTAGSAAGTPCLAKYSAPSPALSFAHNGNNSGNGNGYTYAAGEASVPSPDGCPELQSTFDPNPTPPPGAPLLWSQLEWSPGGGPAAPVSSSCSSSASSSASSSSVVFPGGGTSVPSNANPGLLVPHQLHPGTSFPHLSPPLHMAPGAGEHHLSHQVCSDPGGRGLVYGDYDSGLGGQLPAGQPSDTSGSSSNFSSSLLSSSGFQQKGSRDCSVCLESEVIAALVPCGHNLFCMECANRICEKSEPECPVCHTAVTQAIRIFS